MQKLEETEIDEQLRRLDGWSRGDYWIEKHYRFKTFARAILFVDAVAFEAESLNHHPDIIIHYKEVTLRNWTHVAGGVTERDFELAVRIDQLGSVSAANGQM
jgi:4a-hydroxytetrahydrobiopterin dehydratase